MVQLEHSIGLVHREDHSQACPKDVKLRKMGKVQKVQRDPLGQASEAKSAH